MDFQRNVPRDLSSQYGFGMSQVIVVSKPCIHVDECRRVFSKNCLLNAAYGLGNSNEFD